MFMLATTIQYIIVFVNQTEALLYMDITDRLILQ